MDPDRLVKVEDMEIEEDTYQDKPAVEEEYTRARKKKPFRPVRGTISVLLRYVYPCLP